ncbi:chemotaxis protein CheW [Nitrosomonas sp.]|uniref:chemotaxis protein CheW n=1 Tax=Nitrosomonas sp. TaxID=42353 RepID=UPI001D85D2F9|nr:chemotaxis protein CheW [Nitrosomonas sp.]MBX3617227.1 chemotaxis protein CheW [Nitrosomonas sp.]
MSIEEINPAQSKQKGSTGKQTSTSAVIGVTAGEERYLIPMTEVNEVIVMPKLAHVPLTQSWFLGLANVRGNLYGITDLSMYLGHQSMPFNLKSRVLLAFPGNKDYGGFAVHSMLGIRKLSEFTPVKSPKKKLSAGILAHYQDSEGRIWKELSIFALIRDEKFMQIARSE